VTDQGLIYIANLIQNRPSLRNITINFISCQQITDKGLSAIGDSLKVQRDLRALNIIVEDNILTDVGFLSVNEGIKGLPKLEKIFFDYGCSESLTAKFFENILDIFDSLANSLKSVKLKITCCELVNDKDIEVLSEGFKKLPLLENIGILFYSNPLLTDDCLVSFSKAFKAAKSLKSVHLVFEGCFKITDKGVISLSEGLNKSAYLESVNFDFSWCKDLTNEGVNSLSKCFQRLNLLDDIQLNLEGCCLLTDVGLFSLKETMEKSKLLKAANLLFMNCSKITHEGFEDFVTSLTRKDSLQKLYLSCPFYEME